ncbi:hypothetical protein V6N11_053594 [Hibiscus sabdariffa]|uniref:Uncharacterized protein n=1 Tax=Hibiscus sabdariffa TaxID=183260 RepID=A0ABR2UDC8_9ROSI
MAMPSLKSTHFQNTPVSNNLLRLQTDWDVMVRHVSRDMNKVVDSLAQRGRELGAGSSAFSLPPEGTTTLVIQEQGASGVVPGMHARGAPVISGAVVGIG